MPRMVRRVFPSACGIHAAMTESTGARSHRGWKPLFQSKAQPAGLMLLFSRNRLPESYCALIFARRLYAGP